MTNSEQISTDKTIGNLTAEVPKIPVPTHPFVAFENDPRWQGLHGGERFLSTHPIATAT